MCVSGDTSGSCVWTGLNFYGVDGMVHQLGAKKVAVGNHLRGKRNKRRKLKVNQDLHIHMNIS